MKNLVILFALIMSSLIPAQMAVYDAGTNYQMAQQIAGSSKQLNQLQQTYKVMKEASDKYREINGYVQSMGQLQNIITVQKEAISNANKCLQQAKGKNVNFRDISSNISQISGSIKTVQALLQNNVFKMDDSQRIQLLDKEYQKAQSASMAIKVKLIKLAY